MILNIFRTENILIGKVYKNLCNFFFSICSKWNDSWWGM